jgi:hypothetical protein
MPRRLVITGAGHNGLVAAVRLRSWHYGLGTLKLDDAQS